MRLSRPVAGLLATLFLLPSHDLAAGDLMAGDLAAGDLAALVGPTAGAVDTTMPAFAQPGIHPKGHEIAFIAGGDIWVVPAAGGEAHLLVSHEAEERRPLYSPDGARVAFTSDRAGSQDLYVLELETGELVRLTWDDGDESLDAWSPDGSALWFTSGSQDIDGMTDIFRVPVGGGTPVPVAADRYAPEFFGSPSPAGRLALAGRGRMAYSQWWRNGHSHIDESEIWLVEPGPIPAYSRVTDPGGKHLWPLWIGSEPALVYVSDRSGSENLWRHPVGGRAEPVTDFGSGRVLWPSITADGRTVAFERDFAIWTVDLGSGRAKAVPVRLRGALRRPAVTHHRLTSGFGDLALSPDGEKLTFIARGDVFAVGAEEGGVARRLTATVAEEAEPVWAPDSRRLAYTSRRTGTTRIMMYDFATGEERPVATEGGNHATPVFSPDGAEIAFVRDGADLVVVELETGRERVLASAQLWRPPFTRARPLAWSPDGDWLAFFATDGRMFTNVHVVPADGSGPARAISRLANSRAGALAWAPDGESLFFDTQQRTEDGQIARIDLVPRVPHYRETAFDALFEPEEDEAGEAGEAGEETAGGPDEDVDVVIEFDGIHQRLELLPLGVDAGSFALSPDGETLIFLASAEGQVNLYAWSLDPLADERVARQLTASAGGKGLPWLGPDGTEAYYLERGRLKAVTVADGSERSIAATAELDTDFHAEKLEVFDQAWSYMRDHFYDADMHGADWEAVRRAWEPRIAAAQTPEGLERLIDLMLGELNASHLGHTELTGRDAETGRLGVRLDPAALTEGRHVVSEVLALSPAAVAGIEVGDRLISVDGEPLGPGVALDRLLENTVDDRVTVAIGRDGDERVVTMKPVSTGAEKWLAYRSWVESRRVYVDSMSDGRLGYVHMPDMGWGSLQRLIVDLDAANFDREGVVVDLRANNGGFVNAYALDVFARRGYITMEVRGYPAVPARSMLGQRALELPTVLVTDMHSLSDAEDFTEGYRTLGLGPVVGEPTAGWIIYTWGTRLVDGSYLRMPRSRIRGHDGEVMELNPRPVDVRAVRPLGESYGERDRQLDAAIRVLLDRLP
jgi:Tol biopolymer transport system component